MEDLKPIVPEGIEIRNVAFKVSSDEEKRTIEGYAALFNTASDGLGDLEEIIEPGAFDGVIAKSDVKAYINHDSRRGLLARCKKGKGSMTLGVDTKGLRFSFEAPKTALGEEALENVRRGDVDECSFAFYVESDTWEQKPEGSWKRTIHQFKLIDDVSLVYDAAYSKTSVNLRGKEEAENQIKAEIEKRNQEVADQEAEAKAVADAEAAELLAEQEQEERAKEADLAAYYANIETRFK